MRLCCGVTCPGKSLTSNDALPSQHCAPNKQPAEGITVDGARSSRWAAGADIAITSSTLDWQDSQTATIDSVQPADPAAGNGGTTLKLSSSIADVLSEKETPGMGVEVALLTRNIKIEGEYIEGVSTEFDGGYLQIFHTPGVTQTIEGVEFIHMGQQSAKNRYPIQVSGERLV